MINAQDVDQVELQACSESLIDMIRVASHRETLEKVFKFSSSVLQLGYEVCVNAMGFGCYCEEDVQRLVHLAAMSPPTYLYIADSFGSMTVNSVDKAFKLLKQKLDERQIVCKLGFHPHNNLQGALANSLTALNAGANLVDSTMFGMGRGAGNLCSELIVAALASQFPKRFSCLPCLSFIQNFLCYAQQQTEREIKWGYNLPFMISGTLEVHPNYAKLLLDRDFSVEQIWQLLHKLKESGKHIIYDKQALIDIIDRASFKAKDLSQVPYAMAHTGQEFLIIANGPSLKTHCGLISRFMESQKCITIGLNFLDNMFVPDIHLFTSYARFRAHNHSVNTRSLLYVGSNLRNECIDAAGVAEWCQSSSSFSMAENGMILTPHSNVSIIASGLAIAMGANKIYYAGLDGYVDAEGKVRAELFYQTLDSDSTLRSVHYYVKLHRKIQESLEIFSSILPGGIEFLTPSLYTQNAKQRNKKKAN
jgi:4-hydroxy 2-oxovalerate aldolase